MTIPKLYSIYLKNKVVCTDTRKITEGCLFFALKGENFNGNRFAADALGKGAAYAVVDEAECVVNDKYVLVEDVLATLQQLANYHRNQMDIPFIGITGTNGKTTTKELINSVLSEKYKTLATSGNLNNHIGVPLTLLSVTDDTEIAIIEMGANHQKEIAFLASIAEPDAGLITNVGKAHLEGFGGFEGVKKGKGELYDFLRDSGGVAFVNRDNKHLMEMAGQKGLDNVVYYGSTPECLVTGTLLDNDPFLTLSWRSGNETYTVKSNLTGTYNFENILAAITIGLFFGLSAEQVNKGIVKYVPSNNRSQITRTESNTLICDYYNANPSSMAVALENFREFKSPVKVMILGDMFELGSESPEEHKLILGKALAVPADIRVFIGKEFEKLKNNSPGNYFFSTTDEAFKLLEEQKIKDAAVLIKGSRGMKLERLAALL